MPARRTAALAAFRAQPTNHHPTPTACPTNHVNITSSTHAACTHPFALPAYPTHPFPVLTPLPTRTSPSPSLSDHMQSSPSGFHRSPRYLSHALEAAMRVRRVLYLQARCVSYCCEWNEYLHASAANQPTNTSLAPTHQPRTHAIHCRPAI